MSLKERGLKKAVLKHLHNLSKEKQFTFHCHQKSNTQFIIYGRVQGRPAPELEQFLNSVELTRIGQYKVLSYSYDKDNTCLCLTLENSILKEDIVLEEASCKRLKRTSTPRTRLRSLSDSPILEQVPVSSYETVLNKYYQEGNYQAALEVYEQVLQLGLRPTREMIRTRDYILVLK